MSYGGSCCFRRAKAVLTALAKHGERIESRPDPIMSYSGFITSCLLALMLISITVFSNGGNFGILHNSTWCWIINDTDPAPGKECTSTQIAALEQGDSGTVLMGTRNGDPIHFNSTHNDTKLDKFGSLDDVEICISFSLYSIDSPTCLFRFLEKNSSGTSWHTIPKTAFGGACPPSTGVLHCYDIGPESGGNDNISNREEAENVTFYLYDIDAAGTEEYVEIETLYINVSYTQDTIPAIISMIQPWNKSYSNNSIEFNISANEELSWSVVQLGNTNHSLINQSGQWQYYNDTLGNGMHIAIFWFNDTAGNMNFTDITFTIDTVCPTDIIAESPTLSNNSRTNNNYIEINVTFKDSYPDVCLLELYNGTVANYTMTKTITGTDSGYCFFNATSQPDGDWNYSVWLNDTAGNRAWNGTWYVSVDAVYIIVDITDPVDATHVIQNTIFTVNATVTCIGGFCGNISGRARYNDSVATPDTDISTSDDTPFYIMSGENPGNCTQNPLSADEWCNITWTVNATGALGTEYEIGILLESNESTVSDNYTSNMTVKIVSCLIDITLQWSSISFGELNPGLMGIAAEDNDKMTYNTTIQPATTCDVSLYIISTNFTHNESDYIIRTENITYNNVSNDYQSGYNLTGEWDLLRTSVSPNTNATTFFWLNVPWGVHYGPYSGNMTILAVEKGVVP